MFHQIHTLKRILRGTPLGASGLDHEDIRAARAVSEKTKVGFKVEPDDQFAFLCLVSACRFAQTLTEYNGGTEMLGAFLLEDMVSMSDEERETE